MTIRHTHVHTHTHAAPSDSTQLCVVTNPSQGYNVVLPDRIAANNCAAFGGQALTKDQYALSCSGLGSGVNGYKISSWDFDTGHFCFNTSTKGSVKGVLSSTQGGACSAMSDFSGDCIV